MDMHAQLHNMQKKYYQYNKKKSTLQLSYPSNSQSAQINTIHGLEASVKQEEEIKKKKIALVSPKH